MAKGGVVKSYIVKVADGTMSIAADKIEEEEDWFVFYKAGEIAARIAKDKLVSYQDEGTIPPILSRIPRS
ncbi:MAG: hypothetical protein OXH85_07570 [Truepera sp.]|nr:hypothetical protein [Truepera sp.]